MEQIRYEQSSIEDKRLCLYIYIESLKLGNTDHCPESILYFCFFNLKIKEE